MFIIKKAELTVGFILRQLGGLLKRPGAFSPLLTKGLALSVKNTITFLPFNREVVCK